MPRPSLHPARTNTAAVGRTPQTFVGTSGWAYPTWKPGFYPNGTSTKKLLPFYASALNSVEVNYTFRKLPNAKVLAEWLAATPEGFQFSFKAPQIITHSKRLADCEAEVAEFVTALRPVRDAGKLGLLLFQLPPNFQANPSRLRAFLQSSALAEHRVSFEFRHPTWFGTETESVLRDQSAALCIAESDGLESPEWHPAGTFTSFRLRRTGGYKPAAIRTFAERFAELAASRDVYIYLKHEDEPTGALNAVSLRKALAKLS